MIEIDKYKYIVSGLSGVFNSVTVIWRNGIKTLGVGIARHYWEGCPGVIGIAVKISVMVRADRHMEITLCGYSGRIIFEYGYLPL